MAESEPEGPQVYAESAEEKLARITCGAKRTDVETGLAEKEAARLLRDARQTDEWEFLYARLCADEGCEWEEWDAVRRLRLVKGRDEWEMVWARMLADGWEFLYIVDDPRPCRRPARLA